MAWLTAGQSGSPQQQPPTGTLHIMSMDGCALWACSWSGGWGFVVRETCPKLTSLRVGAGENSDV